MKLLGNPLSPFVRKARIVASEKGIEYDYDPRPGPTGWTDDYEKINPFMRIPALLPDPARLDFAINDSTAICAYFEKLEPTPALYPTDALAYGRALWLEEVADTDLAGTIGLGVFRPVFFNVFAGKPPDWEAADAGFAKLEKKLLPYLETASTDEYFTGDSFSIADIAVATQFMNLRYAGYIVPSDKYPTLAGRLEKISTRPSIAAFIESDIKFWAKMKIEIPPRNY